MRSNAGCHAAWYELNISSADDCVSACCYYNGAKDAWSDEIRPLGDYWNSERMQAIRRINGLSGTEPPGGCEGCYFLGHRDGALYYPSFFRDDPDWSDAQRANWQLSVEDFNAGLAEVRGHPMRYYINFGFACNLSCTMCHQVPRRSVLKRQVSAETVLAWRDEMKSAIDITVIGGEPFVLIEAIKFIRAIIEDPDFEDVQLTICTNGTLHHKFMDLLRKKRKLALVVSLDSIGAEYEAIRVGSSWETVSANIESFINVGQELNYPWTVQSPCMLLGTNIPRLADYARWCIERDIQPGFYDFVNARGIEETFERENVVAHPELLASIPGWQGEFERTIAILERSPFPIAAAQLQGLYRQATANLAALRERREDIAALPRDLTWFPIFDLAGIELAARLEQNFYNANGSLTLDQDGTPVIEAGTLNDHVGTPFLDLGQAAGGWLRVTCGPTDARLFVQDSDFHALVETEQSQTAVGTARLYRVDPGVRSVRLVLSGTVGEKVALPGRITFERPSRGEAMVALDAVEPPPAIAEPASTLATADLTAARSPIRRALTRMLRRSPEESRLS